MIILLESYSHLLTEPSREGRCEFQHDSSSMSLSIFILCGMLLSYLPQHYRIFSTKTSAGISPWFLLLGSTSSTSSLVNVITLQWGVVRCCQVLTAGQCAESLLGIILVFAQWACFNIMLILSLIYFPADQKYVRVVPAEARDRNRSPFDLATNYSSQFLSKFFLKHKRHSTSSAKRKTSKRAIPANSSIKQPQGVSSRPSRDSISTTASDLSSCSTDSSTFDPSDVLPPSATRMTPLTLSKEYTILLVLAFVVLIHFLFSTFITLCILLLLPKASAGEPEGTPPSHSGEHPTVRLLRIWATCSGVLSMLLAGFQYLPQIWLTLRCKLVKSLSIPMMIIQTPGSFIFVYSLAIRPGFNWTTWIVYLVSGILQGFLLVLCVLWKIRQQANGIDDWGKPLARAGGGEQADDDDDEEAPRNERTPLLH